MYLNAYKILNSFYIVQQFESKLY